MLISARVAIFVAAVLIAMGFDCGSNITEITVENRLSSPAALHMEPLRVDPETGDALDVDPRFDYVSTSRLVEVNETRGTNLHDLRQQPADTRYVLSAVSEDGAILWEEILTVAELLAPEARIVWHQTLE